MKHFFILIFYFFRTCLLLLKPGGAKSLVAENIILRKQLIVINRGRKRAPSIDLWDRLVFGFLTAIIYPKRIARAAIIIKPAMLIKFHKALIKRKYRALFSNKSKRKPGSPGLLFKFHRWQANLRILEIEEVKSVPYTPTSHPFVERLIRICRNEVLDRAIFWTASDLQAKLDCFQNYFNEHRTHMGLDGCIPNQISENKTLNLINIKKYRWEKYCRGLFDLPIAA